MRYIDYVEGFEVVSLYEHEILTIDEISLNGETVELSTDEEAKIEKILYEKREMGIHS